MVIAGSTGDGSTVGPEPQRRRRRRWIHRRGATLEVNRALGAESVVEELQATDPEAWNSDGLRQADPKARRAGGGEAAPGRAEARARTLSRRRSSGSHWIGEAEAAWIQARQAMERRHDSRRWIQVMKTTRMAVMGRSLGLQSSPAAAAWIRRRIWPGDAAAMSDLEAQEAGPSNPSLDLACMTW